MITTAEQIKIANKTARSKGSSVFDKEGNIKSVVAKYVEDHMDKTSKILDFGCGPQFVQGQYLNKKGFNVSGYDFGDNALKDNAVTGKHDYDVVYASNVLNVQSDAVMLYETLLTIKSCMKPESKLICNYPSSPRKSNLTVTEVVALMTLVFGAKPHQVGGTNSAPVLRVNYRKEV